MNVMGATTRNNFTTSKREVVKEDGKGMERG